jgi:hypothetical protein
VVHHDGHRARRDWHLPILLPGLDLGGRLRDGTDGQASAHQATGHVGSMRETRRGIWMGGADAAVGTMVVSATEDRHRERGGFSFLRAARRSSQANETPGAPAVCALSFSSSARHLTARAAALLLRSGSR